MSRHFCIVFHVSKYHSGRATYLAKSNYGCSSPYQKPIGNNRCEQDFEFKEFRNLINFIKFAFEEFDEDFEIVHLYIRYVK